MGVSFNRRVLLAGLLLSGCATVRSAPPRLVPAGPHALPELEPLAAARAERGGLVIVLRSKGCLSKDDVRFFVEREGRVATVAFARRRLETCKAAAPIETELRFGWRDLGVADASAVQILNPIG